ncbi:MAG: hypothetical protein WBB33_02695 [Candidatus Saccharimonadales bacterium]
MEVSKKHLSVPVVFCITICAIMIITVMHWWGYFFGFMGVVILTVLALGSMYRGQQLRTFRKNNHIQ